MTTTRVALYTRVSTDMQAGKDEGSLDTQEARLKAFLQSRPGEHVVAATFREEGASGKNLDRPALRRLMDSIKRGEVDLVVVTRLDRDDGEELVDVHSVISFACIPTMGRR